jgi:hypothetical protein
MPLKPIRLRQEVLNTALADLISERYPEITPERVLTGEPGSKAMPDLLARLNGLRVVMECEVGGVAAAKSKALASAKDRVDEGIAAVALALVYAPNLAAQSSVAKVKSLMRSKDTLFEVAVITEAEVGPYSRGTLDYVCTVLHEAWRKLLKEDALSAAVSEIDAAVEAFAESIDGYSGIASKLAHTLGIQGAPDKKIEALDE